MDPRFSKHIVRRAEWDGWIDEDEEDIRLIDWGESFRQGEEPERLAQPADCRAPETLFAEKIDYRVDLWRTGVVVRFHVDFLQACCNAYNSLVISHGHWGKTFWARKYGNKYLVDQMINFVEDLPDEWRDQWLNMEDQSSTGPEGRYTLRPPTCLHRVAVSLFSVPVETLEVSELEKRFEGLLENPEDPPLRPLLLIVQGLMRFRPSDRLSASQALELLPEA